MSETWIAYLERVGVLSDGVELCNQCKRRMGTVQMFGGIGGKAIPVHKMCVECHGLWKRHARLVVR